MYRAPELGTPHLPTGLPPGCELKAGHLPGWYFVDLQGGGTAATVGALARVADSAVLPVFRDKFGGPMVFADTLHIRFNENVSADACEAVLRSVPNLGFKRMALSNLYSVKLKEKDGYKILDIANELAMRNDVRFATPSSMLSGRKSFTPNDPYFDRQWGLGSTSGYPAGWGTPVHMNVVGGWDITTGSPSVKVAVLDDGIQLNHPDIPIVNAKDFIFVTGTGGPRGQFDIHGTTMAGIIGASINNAKGIAGVASGCGLVSVRVHQSTGVPDGSFVTTAEAVYNGLLWAMSLNCKVSNNSNSYGGTDPLIDDAYFAAYQSGMANFAAAGNTGGTAIEYPAELEHVSAVTGVMPNGGSAPDATWGPEMAFSATGSYVVTTDRTGDDGYPPFFFPAILSTDQNYVLFDGVYASTSFGCAYASGVAALVLSLNPGLSPGQLTNVLASTATDFVVDASDPMSPMLPGRDERFGYGLLNAGKAMGTFLLQSLTATPNPVKGGLVTLARVDLSLNTSANLSYVVRSENETVIPADKIINIAAGQNNGSVNLETNGVDVATPVTLNVDAVNIRRSVVVNVIPATLNRFALSVTSVFGGEALAGQVELAGRAGPSGSVIIITDDSTSVNTPSSVRIPAQLTKLVFKIPTVRTTTTHTANLRARQGAIIFNRTLTVKRVLTDINTFTLAPTVVMGGTKSFGTVTMTVPAPAGGALITFKDNSTVTSFVNSITIPQGSSSGVVQVNTGPVGATSQATITATYIGVSKTANLTITPTLWVTSLTVTPESVRGGFPAIGRIQIYSNAPSGGVPVAVTDTNSYASTPTTVVVPAGRNWVEFTVTTFPTNVTITGDVRATYGGVTKVAPLTVFK